MDSALHHSVVFITGGEFTRIRSNLYKAGVATVTVVLFGWLQQHKSRRTRKASTAVGVTVTVKADTWSGQPAELTDVIPLLVTIENNSGDTDSAGNRLRSRPCG